MMNECGGWRLDQSRKETREMGGSRETLEELGDSDAGHLYDSRYSVSLGQPVRRWQDRQSRRHGLRHVIKLSLSRIAHIIGG